MNIHITRAAYMLLFFLTITGRTALLAQNPHDYGWQVGYGFSVGSSIVKDDTMFVGGDFDYIGPYTGSMVSADLGTAAIKKSFPIVNGTVRVMLPDGNGGYYIGGDFTRVGGYERVGLAHILADKTLDPNWKINVDVGRGVYALQLSVTKDTMWVGGNFNTIGGLNKNAIAAIRVNTSTVISDWGPGLVTKNWWAPATVSSLAYFPGLPYEPVPKLIIGGDFSGFNWTISKANLAALNPVNGQPISAWKGDVTPCSKSTGGYVTPVVRALLIYNGYLYIGGCFTRITGTNGAFNKHSLAAMRLGFNVSETGYVDSYYNSGEWIYPKTEGGRVNCFGLVKDGSGATVLGIGGKFYYASSNSINQSFVMTGLTAGEYRRYYNIVSEPFVNGAVKDTTYVPNVYETGEIFAFDTLGSQVVLGGNFEGASGSEWSTVKIRRNLAILDMTNSKFRDWAPVMQTNLPVRALHISGSEIVTAGSFTSAGGALRRNMAAVLLSSYTILPFDPRPDSYVNDMVLSPTRDTLYIGGNFTQIGTSQRGYTAGFDLRTKTLLPWSTTTATGGGVEDLLLDPARNILYAGGKFTKLSSYTRNHLAALDSRTGQVINNWTADVGTINGQITPVRSLALSPSGDTLFVGGRFDNIAGQARANLAALKTTLTVSPSGATATLLPWNFPVAQAQADIGVCALLIENGRMYVGGKYNSIGGNSGLQNLAAISLGNPNALDASWAPVIRDGGGGVWCMQAVQGALYIGGDFGTIDGVPVSMAGALNLSDGSGIAAWKPYPNIQYGVGGIILNLMVHGPYVYLGGSMENMTEGVHDAVYHLATISSMFDALPERIISFTAAATASGCLVQWKTPEDISAVILQRSTDGIYFSDMGTYNPGTASWLDKTVLPGTTYYYRLKCRTNGTTTYSKVRVVTMRGSSHIRLLNNVIFKNSPLRIVTTEPGYSLRVFTAGGQLVLEKKLQQGINDISYGGWRAGAYFYSVSNNSERACGKLVVQ